MKKLSMLVAAVILVSATTFAKAPVRKQTEPAKTETKEMKKEKKVKKVAKHKKAKATKEVAK